MIYFEAQELPELYDFFTSLPTTVVVDHMGRPDVTQPVDGPEFELFVKLHARARELLVQGELPRAPVARRGPPMATTMSCRSRGASSRSFPDRVLWGTDWPHPNMKIHMPDDGKLVDFIPRIAPTGELQRKLLVDNPDAALLESSDRDGSGQTLRRHPRHDRVRRRAGRARATT